MRWRSTTTATLACLASACCGTQAATSPTPEAPAPDDGAPAQASAGISAEEAVAIERLATRGYHIVGLTVVTADPRPAATNGEPPRLTVDIDELVAGDVPLGPMAAEWSPPPSGVDWVGRGAAEARAAWAARPLVGPARGARLLVLGRIVDGVFRVASRLREPYTPERARALAEAVARLRAEDAARDEARRAADEARARDEAERVKSADPAALAARAEVVVVATMRTLGIDAEGHRVMLVVSERLDRGAPLAELPMFLVGDEEMRRFTTDGPVLVFLASARWPAALGGELDGLRLVDARHGVLPASEGAIAAARQGLR